MECHKGSRRNDARVKFVFDRGDRNVVTGKGDKLDFENSGTIIIKKIMEVGTVPPVPTITCTVPPPATCTASKKEGKRKHYWSAQ